MKNFKTILALALALALVFSLSIPAFAADEPAAPAAPAAYISKDLNIAVGTTTPTVNFKFDFAPNTEKSVGVLANEHPVIASKTLSYSKDVVDVGENGVITLVTPNILEGLTFPHAGVYAYNVTEDDTTYDVGNGETMVFDETVHVLHIYVVNDGDGTKIENVTLTDPNGNKKELTGDGTENGSTTDVNDENFKASNDFRFSNTYTKLAGDKDGNSLVLSKTVTGDYGNKTSLEFDFSLTVNKPDTSDKNVTEFDYVLTKDDQKTEGKGTYGTALEFKLTHDDTLVLKNVVAGSTYSVTETGTKQYSASAKVDGTTEYTADKGKSLTVPYENALTLDDDGTIVAFTNEHDKTDAPPTGISINNLPFLMLISVSALGLFVLFVSKKRRAEEA